MVSVNRDDDRAQLLLTGALAVAFVVIGLVVIVNTLVVSETGTNPTSLDRSGQVENFVFETERNVRRLLLELNHQKRTLTGPTLNDAIQENVSRYGRLLGESYGESGPAYVDLAYHNDTSTWGNRLVQSADDRFLSPGDATDWWVIRNVTAERRSVGRFVVNADMRERWLAATNVTATNATGGSITLELGKERDEALRVDWTASDRPDGTTTCPTTGGRVLVDLVTGRSVTGDCRFPGLGAVDGPVALRIENGQGGIGKYGLVVNETLDRYDDGTTDQYDGCDGVATDVPCTTPVVWAASVTVTYDSPGTTIDRTRNVSVYP